MEKLERLEYSKKKRNEAQERRKALRGRGGAGPVEERSDEEFADDEGPLDVPPWRWEDPVSMANASIETLYARAKARDKKERSEMVRRTAELRSKNEKKGKLSGGSSASGSGPSQGPLPPQKSGTRLY